jgi:predicted ABC-type ATPase
VTAPLLTIIAGANGCGKSTLTKWARVFFQQTATLDPDAVAVELQAETSGELSPIEAGKRVLLTAEGYLQKGISFSVETTLSGNTYLRMLADAKKLGYRTCLFYIGTERLTINIARVQARVLKGGHDVPVEDQARRYPRSFKNLPRALALADEGILLDNSTNEGHRVVALKLEGRRQILLFEPVPDWAAFLKNC